MIGYVVLFLQCLLSMNRVLIWSSMLHKPHVVAPNFIPALGRKKQENQKFRIVLSYIANLRLPWDKYI